MPSLPGLALPLAAGKGLAIIACATCCPPTNAAEVVTICAAAASSLVASVANCTTL